MPVRNRDDSRSFDHFVHDAERRLSFALGAAYGPEVGAEATAEALAYAWEHWERIAEMGNPIGYLYRVGQSRSRRFRWRRPPVCPVPTPALEPWAEPGLPAALERLSRPQRVVVVLVAGFDWTQQEVADLLGISRSSVQKRLSRGMSRLRADLKVDSYD